jgi:DNA-binding transcriptional LysR family regulator
MSSRRFSRITSRAGPSGNNEEKPFMRRLLASLLLVLISLSLVSPVLASAAKSDVPACCLRNGKHHCEMGAEISTHGKPGLRARCPFQTQGSLLAANNQKLLAATRSGVGIARLPATALASLPDRLPDMRQTATYGTRGPPSRFA